MSVQAFQRGARESHESIGHGVGLRPSHYTYVLENSPPIDWFEVISENFIGLGDQKGGRPSFVLEQIRAKYPIVLHGVSLSIGSVDPLNQDYLDKLKELIHQIEPAWISDHLCWTGVEGHNLHDLLPLPYNEETIAHVVSRINDVQEFLGRQMVFENVSSYMTFESSEMSEWEFVTEITRRSGCALLLDINNIYVSATNHGFDPNIYLNGIPVDSVKQFHLAGHSIMELGDQRKFLIDTHDHPVCDDVWSLYENAIRRFGKISTLIEWDDNIPDFSILMAESNRAKEIEERVLAERRTHEVSQPTTLASMDHHRA
ncbi:MAG: DUF692 domain-containing protein [Bacteriovoracia bacterium]